MTYSVNPPPPTTSQPGQSRLELLVILVLVAAGLGIYGQTLAHPFISFDDPDYVFNNPHVRSGLSWENWWWAWTSFERSNWHPLTWLSLMLDAQLYGLNAGGYHLTNLLLHLANAVLLFRWLRTATGALWPSAWTALFFVVHPLHVESVAWVTERKDVLSTLFFCLTLLAYTRHARGGGWAFYTLSLGSFALGLAAKPMLVTLPILLLLLDFWPLRRNVAWTRRLLEKLPFFLLVAASCMVTLHAQRTMAMVPLESLSVARRIGAAMLGYGFYLRKTFWPVALGIYYPYWHAQWILAPWAWGAGLVAVTALAIWHARRMPWLFVGWCWFVGTLVPVIGVVQVGGQAAADRYTYLPHIGLFIALCWTLDAWARRKAAARPWIVGAATAGAMVCTALGWRQAGYWRDSVTLFEHTIAVVEPTSRLYHLLADALADADKSEAAEAAYRRAWSTGPHAVEIAAPWSGLLLKQNRWPEAIAVLQSFATDPRATEVVLNNLGFALIHVGRKDEAETVYRRCTRQYPEYARAHFSLGELLMARGDTMDAMGEYEAGLATQDDWVPALTRLAWLYAQSSNGELHDRAFILARRAVSLSGGHDLASLDALAAAAAAVNHWDEAVRTAQSALALASQPGAPKGAEALCRHRLEMYQRGQTPTL